MVLAQRIYDNVNTMLTFVSGDILAKPMTPEGQVLARLQGQIDTIFASSFCMSGTGMTL